MRRAELSIRRFRCEGRNHLLQCNSKTYLFSALVSLVFWLGLIVGVSSGQAEEYFLGRSGYSPLADTPLRPGRIYEGSSAEMVDDFLRKVPENSTIRLANHTFETRGVWDNWLGNLTQGFRLKSGWKIIGAGTNSLTGTVFRLIDVPVDQSGLYNANAVFSTGGIGLAIASRPLDRRPNVDNLTIRDLQIDCNYPNLARVKRTAALQVAAIQVLGNRGINLSNILVRNAASKKVNARGQQFECFQVYAYNYWATNGAGDYFVDRVAITEYWGGDTSGICLNGNARATIQNCTVDLASDRAQRYGLNFAAGLQDFMIVNNAVFNTTRGINNDTAPVCSRGIIAQNRLANCGTGMFLALTQNSQILSNSIGLDGTGCGIALRAHPTLADTKSGACVVRENVLLGVAGEGISLCFQNEFDPTDRTLHWSSENVIQNNIFSAGLQNKIPPASLARNTVRPGNRRHALNYPACGPSGELANLSAIGFPSDIGVGAPCAYCDSRALDTTEGYIARVRMDGTRLDVRSDSGDGSGYSDFTTGYEPGIGPGKSKQNYHVQWADLQRGRTYRINVKASGLKNPRSARFRVFVDWDHNGRFDGGGEEVDLSGRPGTASGNVVVPASALAGSTRMRVSLGVSGLPGPCDFLLTRGEVEDYTISVLP